MDSIYIIDSKHIAIIDNEYEYITVMHFISNYFNIIHFYIYLLLNLPQTVSATFVGCPRASLSHNLSLNEIVNRIL